MTAGVSGNLYTMASTYIKVAVEYSEDYSISNNTSDVTLTLWYQRTNSYGYSTYAYGNYQVRLGDTFYTVYSGTFTIPPNDNNWKKVGSVTVRGVQHGTDGSERVKIGGKFTNTGQGVSVMDFNFYDNVDLTTIPRTSKVSVTPSVLTVGNTLTINTNRASTSFTHTISIAFDNYSWTATGVGASTTWSDTVATLMPYMDTWQKEVTVTCTTYNGTTSLGSTKTTFTLQVDTSVYKPVITYTTPTDVNANTMGLVTVGTFIKGYSTLETTIEASANDTTYGDTVAKIEATLGNTSDSATGSGQALAMVFDGTPTTNQLIIKATDNRGYTVTETVSLTLINYSKIQIQSVEYVRVNSSNVETETGEYVRYTIKVNAFLGSFGRSTNTITVKSQSKLASAQTYDPLVTEKTVTTSGSGMGDLTITGVTVGTYSPSSQYDIMFTLADLLSNVNASVLRIHEGVPVAAWGEDHFDIYGEFHVHDREDVTQYTTIYPTGYRWQLAGTANSTTAINFDSTICSEIMLVATYVEDSTHTWMATATVPTDVLTTHGFFLMMPARISAVYAQDKGCLIQITDTYARINEWYDNRSFVAGNASLAVYYR